MRSDRDVSFTDATYGPIESSVNRDQLRCDCSIRRKSVIKFCPSTEEKRVWFAIEIVNPTSRDALIVGFATSCQCTTIDQALPTPLPRGQSRFLTGSVDTSDLTSEIIIDSQVFIDTTQSDSTRFRVKIHQVIAKSLLCHPKQFWMQFLLSF